MHCGPHWMLSLINSFSLPSSFEKNMEAEDILNNNSIFYHMLLIIIEPTGWVLKVTKWLFILYDSNSKYENANCMQEIHKHRWSVETIDWRHLHWFDRLSDDESLDISSLYCCNTNLPPSIVGEGDVYSIKLHYVGGNFSNQNLITPLFRRRRLFLFWDSLLSQ